MTLTIYDWHTGPYPARVRIALAERGLRAQARFVPVNLWKGEHKTAEFRAKNYSGTLPVLELDDDTLITECTAITEYLDTLDGTPQLTGKTPRDKGIIHMMSRRAEIEVLEALSLCFHHATPGFGPHVEVYQNQDWGLYQRDKAISGMRYIDGALQDQTFVAGSDFSMADIALAGGMIFATPLAVPVPEECRALLSWYARMQKHPSVQNWQTMSAQSSDEGPERRRPRSPVV